MVHESPLACVTPRNKPHEVAGVSHPTPISPITARNTHHGARLCILTYQHVNRAVSIPHCDQYTSHIGKLPLRFPWKSNTFRERMNIEGGSLVHGGHCAIILITLTSGYDFICFRCRLALFFRWWTGWWMGEKRGRGVSFIKADTQNVAAWTGFKRVPLCRKRGGCLLCCF